ncbi:MAG: hypothetical protein ABSH01_19080 [Terriglobia bacterium]
MMPMDDPATTSRHWYCRAKAVEILDELATVEPFRRELYMAAALFQAIEQYEHGLEAIVNEYHRIACDALATKLPEPFVLPLEVKP